ncbi:MAG: CDP-2,3-bis-(O-geranylgeranyl)-sn-glycerol synthase [Thermoplasmata archaeon]|nr:CDP-2,3-bis-(O-geranylgeranyl)-sn-glycerol synthase [Thermoplasmata archaeon]
MNLTTLLTETVRIFIILLPAYVANPLAVLFGGGTPVDFKRYWKDGRRILGDGKTWRGLFGGTLSGGVVGIVVVFLLDGRTSFFTVREIYGGWDYFIFISFWLAFGGLMGDMLGSFIKRRLGLKRGEKAPGLDQWDFIIGAFLLLLFIPSFIIRNFLSITSAVALLILLLLTPSIHRAVNIVGYRLGLKKEPW